jgi:hypothetical protein
MVQIGVNYERKIVFFSDNLRQFVIAQDKYLIRDDKSFSF